jgi:hypothetical protein
MKTFTFIKHTSNLLPHMAGNYDVKLNDNIVYTKIMRGFLRVEHHLLPTNSTTPLWIATQPIMSMGLSVVEGKYKDIFSVNEKNVPEYSVERASWWSYTFKTTFGRVLVWERPMWSWQDEILGKDELTGEVVVKLHRKQWSLWNEGTIDISEKEMSRELESFVVLVALTLLDMWQHQNAHR